MAAPTRPDAREARPAFRPDIDGLRAIAVGAVLLFHFDLLGARGGFAGVDIFFVISGYLMTQILTRTDPGTLRSFFRRRFWRIAPAYFVTLAATLAAGGLILLDDDRTFLALSAAAASLFASNVFFGSGASYFDDAAIYKPLLHTWSLGVEAQFYLVWPLLLRLVRGQPRRRFWIIAALALASFVACQILSITDAKVAFFSLPARLWEFAAGALAAEMRHRLRDDSTEGLRQTVSLAALTILAASPWLFSDDGLWPAPFALLPCAATATLLLLGGCGGWSDAVLGAPPMRALGTLSYALYLVHWPLVSFLSYAHFPEPPLALRLAGLCVCVPLAWALHRYVEVPLRAYGKSPRPLLRPAALVAALAAVSFVPGLIAARHGPVLAPGEALDRQACAPWRAALPARICLVGDVGMPPDTILWGDSHALHWQPGFAALAATQPRSIAIAAKDACPPIAGVARVANSFVRRRDCQSQNAAVLAAILATPSVKTIVLAARWAFYGETTRFGAERGSPAFLVSDEAPTLSRDTTRALFEAKLGEEVAKLVGAGKRVVLIAQVPETGFDALRCRRLANSEACDIPRAAVDSRQAYVTRTLRALAARTGATLVDPKDLLCDAQRCRTALAGIPAYRDNNHLSADAARDLIARMFRDPALF